MLHIVSVSDVHSPRYLPLFFASITTLRLVNQKADLIILAGDMVEKNSIDNMKPIISVLNKLVNKNPRRIPIVAVFGNEEYIGFEHRYREMYPEVLWLDDEYTIIEIKDAEICIVGSRGVLERPTTWQKKNIPCIENLYSNRLRKIKELLNICREYRLSILVTHYASTSVTLQGEPPQIHYFLGYKIIEYIDSDLRPDISIHGHVHNSTKTYAMINTTKIFNVSLPAIKHITVIDVNI
ncbi:MAG: metallophosphoesterase [Ignisphaera sp.]|uniref:Metallophosphoesterase n=1 Tax=Ignisphaera aggregans TaxID=334771 RepID=A0A7J3MWJ1_9CREN